MSVIVMTAGVGIQDTGVLWIYSVVSFVLSLALFTFDYFIRSMDEEGGRGFLPL